MDSKPPIDWSKTAFNFGTARDAQRPALQERAIEREKQSQIVAEQKRIKREAIEARKAAVLAAREQRQRDKQLRFERKYLTPEPAKQELTFVPDLEPDIYSKRGPSTSIQYQGKRYGKLVALSAAGHSRTRGLIINCKCDCGRECQVEFKRLRKGRARSCGCLRKSILDAAQARRDAIREVLEESTIEFDLPVTSERSEGTPASTLALQSSESQPPDDSSPPIERMYNPLIDESLGDDEWLDVLMGRKKAEPSKD